MSEYSRIVNFFIDCFFEKTPEKQQLLKHIVNLPVTWLSARLRKVAAREAIDLIRSVKEKGITTKPHHNGKSMHVSSTIACLQGSGNSFDRWLHLASMGGSIILDLPIKLHKHYHKLLSRGKQLASYIVKHDCVQLCFEIETGTKKTEGMLIGIDSGINALASTSNQQQYGKDIKGLLEVIKRKKHGSKKQQQARRALKQRINEVAKEVVTPDTKLVVVEDLKKLNNKTKLKRRLSKNMRRSLGAWTYRYWLNRIQLTCEDNRVSFRRVNPAYTSQRCSACNHTERRNRNGELFLCKSCGYTCNADINAAKNILFRFLSGPYGAAYKPKNKEDKIFQV